MESSRPGRGTHIERSQASLPASVSSLPPPNGPAGPPPDRAPGSADPALRADSGAEPWGTDRSFRPVRAGTLRELLDAEFRRNHRFETLSSFFGDLRTLLRKAVVREEQTLGMERFLPNTPGREM